jgi:hypothetical protein
MPAQFEVGQEVLIRPVKEKGLSVREAALSPYAGMSGTVTNYYWIRSPIGKVFYLYTVQTGAENKEIVLYEDEITYLTRVKTGRSKVRGE